MPPRTTAKKDEAPAAETARLVIDPVRTETLLVPIVGTAPLIVSRFSEKAKQQMLDAQLGVKRQREKRDPEAEYRASMYTLRDEEDGTIRYGFPSMAFKMATIGACRYYGRTVKMTEVKQFMFVHGISSAGKGSIKLTLIDGEPVMREDYVRLAGPSRPADLRYRACFQEWSAVLEVTYTDNLLDRTSLINLIEAGGFGVGVGEWRPERNGDFGTYRISDQENIRSVAGGSRPAGG